MKIHSKKSSVTLFLSLSLSIFIGFNLLLTEISIYNAEKLRFETITDIAINAVLGEYSKALFERYGLFYIDASYLEGDPSIDRVQERIKYYLSRNSDDVFSNHHAPWGRIAFDEVNVKEFETACANMGASLRNQVNHEVLKSDCFDESCQIVDKVIKEGNIPESYLERDALREWRELMEMISGMELPKIMINGKEEEVPLSNPSDGVFSMCGSDLIYLSVMDMNGLSDACVELESYISHKPAENTQSFDRSFLDSKELFVSFQTEKLGNYMQQKEDGLLHCQREYVLFGRESDFDNVKEFLNTCFALRMADNTKLAFEDPVLYEEALSTAMELLAVSLAPEFLIPVTSSILYACAFLETVCDLRVLVHGGTVPIVKSSHHMSVRKVSSSLLYEEAFDEGFCYEEYLTWFLLRMNPELSTMRTMDIFEMDIRLLTSNMHFSMDYCVERVNVTITGKGSYGKQMWERRKYGYF